MWLICCCLLLDIVAAAVLSGNRNFEGRVHPLTRANYLASPPLVVAYALAGTVINCVNLSNFNLHFCHHHIAYLTLLFHLISQVNIDFETEPIGTGKNGKDVFLRDIWPTTEEIAEVYIQLTTREQNIPLIQDY